MRRIIALSLAALFVLAFAACGEPSGNVGANLTAVPTEKVTEIPTAVPTEAPTEAPTPEPEPEPEEIVFIDDAINKASDRLIYHPEVGAFYISDEGGLFCLGAENKDGIIEGAPMTKVDVGGRSVDFFAHVSDFPTMKTYLMDTDVVKAVVLFHGYGYPGFPENKYDGEYFHSLVYMKKDGTVWLRGSNMYGMFGDFVKADIPVKIFEGAKGIGTDGEYSVSIVDKDNKLWVFGGLGNFLEDYDIPQYVTDNVDPEGTMGMHAFRTLDGKLYSEPWITVEGGMDPEGLDCNGLWYGLIAEDVKDFAYWDGIWYVVSNEGVLTEIRPSSGHITEIAENAVSVSVPGTVHGRNLNSLRPISYITENGEFYVFERTNIDAPIEPVKVGENAVCGCSDWGNPWFIKEDGTLHLVKKGTEWRSYSRNTVTNSLPYAATTETEGECIILEKDRMGGECAETIDLFWPDYYTDRDIPMGFLTVTPERFGYELMTEAPLASDMKMPVSYDGPTAVDLDFDGLDDTVTLVHEGDEEYWMYNRHFDRLLITLGSVPGKVFRFDFETFEAEAYIVDCDVNDGRLDVLLAARFDEEDAVKFLRVNEDGDGIDLFAIEDYAALSPDFDPADGIEMWIWSYMIAGGSWLKTVVTATADGVKLLTPLSWDRGRDIPAITLTKDLKAVSVDTDGSIGTEITIPAGTEIRPYETDGGTYVDFLMPNGDIVRVFVEYVNDAWETDGTELAGYYEFNEDDWWEYWY